MPILAPFLFPLHPVSLAYLSLQSFAGQEDHSKKLYPAFDTLYYRAFSSFTR